MPAEFMAAAVSVSPNSVPQPLRLGDQGLARHGLKIVVHIDSLLDGRVTEVHLPPNDGSSGAAAKTP
jgi:hypothetical protein